MDVNFPRQSTYTIFPNLWHHSALIFGQKGDHIRLPPFPPLLIGKSRKKENEEEEEEENEDEDDYKGERE